MGSAPRYGWGDATLIEDSGEFQLDVLRAEVIRIYSIRIANSTVMGLMGFFDYMLGGFQSALQVSERGLSRQTWLLHANEFDTRLIQDNDGNLADEWDTLI